MIQIGKINTLQVNEALPFGFHLSSGDPDDPLVLLPNENNTHALKVGEEIAVFVATDDTGTLVAWTTPPVAQCGETVILKAVGVAHFGAFFHWGLNKDLLVPSGMQEGPVNVGMNYVVHIYYDENTQRVLGATKLHKFLKESAPYLNEGDSVSCMVYAKTELGFKVVINKQYLGLIFHSDAFKKLKIGGETDAVIKTIRPDGKIDVALQRVDKAGRQSLEEAILDDLKNHGGISTLTDKSQPEEIYAHFNVSKAAYKKAIGGLYKQRLITIDKNTIRLV